MIISWHFDTLTLWGCCKALNYRVQQESAKVPSQFCRKSLVVLLAIGILPSLFLAVSGVCQTPLFLRQLRRNRIPTSALPNKASSISPKLYLGTALLSRLFVLCSDHLLWVIFATSIIGKYHFRSKNPTFLTFSFPKICKSRFFCVSLQSV